MKSSDGNKNVYNYDIVNRKEWFDLDWLTQLRTLGSGWCSCPMTGSSWGAGQPGCWEAHLPGKKKYFTDEGMIHR